MMKGKDDKNAEDYLLRAVRTAAQYRNGTNEHTNALTALGCYYIERGQPAKGLAYLEKALASRKNLSQYLKLRIWGNMGKAWVLLKDYPKAIYYQKQALEQAADDPEAHVSGYKVLADIYAEMQNHKEAYKYILLYLQIRDSISGEKTKDNINRINAQYQLAVKDKEIATKELELSRQNRKLEKRNTFIAFISFSSLLSLTLLVVLYRNVQHRRRLTEEKMNLMQKEQEIKQLKAMMGGEEKERIRIGRELHDGIGGMMAALKMRFSTLQEDHRLNHISDIREIMQMLDETGSEVRQTAHNLMPEILLRLGLPEAIKQYIQWQSHVGSHGPVEMELQLHGNLEGLPLAFQLILYRILQELIKNIIQHADAGFAMVQLGRDDQAVLTLTVEDNGKGFDAEQQMKGMGLQNILNRVKLYKGTISIQSVINKGTFIQIEFDLDKMNHY